MYNSDAQPIVSRLLEHLDRRTSWKREAATSIPTANYTDADHLALECDRLLQRHPQAVALSAELAAPGSWVTRDLMGLSIIVTRTGDGTVAALVNVCAHRGARVADGRGCSQRLSCPYHAWTYRPDGTLVGLPDAESFPDRTVPGPGLVPLPAVEDHGIVWVVADPGRAGASLSAPDLGPIGRDLDSFELDRLEFWRSHRFELEFNWKLVIDTFLEPYHFASLHKNTVGPYFVPNLCVAERFGHHVREILPRRTLASLNDVAPDRWDVIPHSAMVYVLFPTTVFVMQVDHVEVWRVQPVPGDPHRCRCELDFHVPVEPAGDDSRNARWEKNWKITIDTVLDEDFAAMATVQRGMASGVFEEVTFGRNEPALALFHESLADALDSTNSGRTVDEESR